MNNPITKAIEALEGVIRVADRATVEFDAAKAALASLRAAQEGGLPPLPPHPKRMVWTEAEIEMIKRYARHVRALAAAGGGVPQGWKLVPVEALTRWRDAFAEELAAYDIDPPIHHVKTSHDEIDAMLASSPQPEAAPCFCDRTYPDSNSDASCGDCPKRDYKTKPEAAPTGFAWVNVNGRQMLARMDVSTNPTVAYSEAAPSAGEVERTPQDYAIEHAEYMAQSAEFLIAAVNDLAKAEVERDDGQAEESDVRAAQETLSEALTSMHSGIHEFRKRRDRAALSHKEQP